MTINVTEISKISIQSESAYLLHRVVTDIWDIKKVILDQWEIQGFNLEKGNYHIDFESKEAALEGYRQIANGIIDKHQASLNSI